MNQGIPNTKCYIKSQAGSPYAVRFRISSLFTFPDDTDAVTIFVYVDGKPFDNKCIRKGTLAGASNLGVEYVTRFRIVSATFRIALPSHTGQSLRTSDLWMRLMASLSTVISSASRPWGLSKSLLRLGSKPPLSRWAMMTSVTIREMSLSPSTTRRFYSMAMVKSMGPPTPRQMKLVR
ncbi:hypothetical protein FOYG_15062 [Fusarium oxysporum NRRL 32931]|uniref:DUF7918 domain-containing protein n=1 Tax=Fusarium oxysporum NRRL 32931 TaxID=660029 RepID=W9HL39_FUSOX|nr:hypothetical protein FOYG_15062 [Fusarium oxysporum NRRL 32931]